MAGPRPRGEISTSKDQLVAENLATAEVTEQQAEILHYAFEMTPSDQKPLLHGCRVLVLHRGGFYYFVATIALKHVGASVLFYDCFQNCKIATVTAFRALSTIYWCIMCFSSLAVLCSK